MTAAKPLNLRLYLEGIEVPVVSAQVSININAPSTASIQILPLDRGIDLKPRTMVHLFSYDDRADAPSTYVDKGTYRLLFAGEAIGFSVVKDPNSRALVLQCVDFSSYWSAAHATAIEYQGDASNSLVDFSDLYAGDRTLFDDLPGGTVGERLTTWLDESPRTPGLDTIKGLAGGIIRLIESIGGIANKTGSRQTGFNDFFTVAELRARILQQICAEENDKSASNLLKTSVSQEWLLNALQNLGRQITLADAIQLLLRYIYYDYVPNPTAHYVPSKVTDKYVTETTILSDTANGRNAKYSLEDARDRLQKAVDAISDADGNQPLEQYAFLIQKDLLRNLLPLYTNSLKLMEDQKVIHPQASAQIDDIISKIQSAFNYILEYDSPDITVGDVRGAYTNTVDALVAMGYTSYAATKVSNTAVGGTSQRLYSLIFRPNCWFAAPPRCNILFPELYSTLSYDRNWVGEVTRVLAGTNSFLVGNDASNLMNHLVFAPPVDFLAKDDVPENLRSYRILMNHELHTGIVPRTLWVPDSLSGWTEPSSSNPSFSTNDKAPKEDWMKNASIFHFFSARFETRSVSVSGRYNPNLVCGFPGAVILSPLQVKHDSKSKKFGVDELLEKVGADIPYQLVGMIVGLNHNVDQNGGVTSVSMSHVRRHRGLDDELLSLKYEKKATVEKIIRYTLNRKDVENEPDVKSVWVAKKTGEVLGEGPMLEGRRKALLWGSTPQGDAEEAAAADATKSTRTVEQSNTDGTATVTTTSIDPASKGYKTLKKAVPLTKSSKSKTKGGTKVPFVRKGNIQAVPDAVDVDIPDGKIEVILGETEGIFGGKVVGVQVMNGKRTKVKDKYFFESVTIYETMNVSYGMSPPLEEIVRPSWFSDGYANDKIGDRIYEPFFGCRSIVDEIDVQFPGKGTKAHYDGSSTSTEVDPTKSWQEVYDSVQKIEQARARNSVDRAITWWSYIYGEVKTSTGTARDVERFIRDFTHRPIATIDEVLGSSDLTYDISGNKASVLTGSQGFHSTAVFPDIVEASQNNRMLGLLEDPDASMPRLDNNGPQAAVPKKYDVRYEKRQAVLAYRNAVYSSRAFRG